MPIAVLWFLAFAAGAAVTVQAGINQGLGRRLEHGLFATCVSFSVGTLTAYLATALIVGRAPSFEALSSAPWWQLVGGGLIGAAFVTSAILLVPRIGYAPWTALILAGQILCSLLLDRFGAFSLQPVAISGTRLVGALLVLVGAILVTRR